MNLKAPFPYKITFFYVYCIILEASQLYPKDVVTGKVKYIKEIMIQMLLKRSWNLRMHPNDSSQALRQFSRGYITGLNKA
jgi:hypothetical protein